MSIGYDDLPRVAAMGRTAGELVEAWGPLMWRLTQDWEPGAKTANLDPNRGRRWENCDGSLPPAKGCVDCPHEVPSDPTGEAAVNAAQAQVHGELRERLERWQADSAWLRDMAHVLAPIVPPSIVQKGKIASKEEAIWCQHHLRVGLCEPRHRTLTVCRWCYDFRALWQADPPPTILRDRHAGKRITEKACKAALEAEGLIVQEVEGVSKVIGKARGRTGRPNQNERRKRDPEQVA